MQVETQRDVDRFFFFLTWLWLLVFSLSVPFCAVLYNRCASVCINVRAVLCDNSWQQRCGRGRAGHPPLLAVGGTDCVPEEESSGTDALHQQEERHPKAQVQSMVQFPPAMLS